MEKQKEYRFGPFRLSAAERCLWRDGERVQLGPKVFETLLVLVERSGEVVTKDELFSRVWPGTFVDESSLSQNIRLLRKAIGDDYVETVPKVGYRFAKPITLPAPQSGATPRRRWLWAGASSVLIVGAAVMAGRHWSTAAAPVHSVAVLPFISFGEQSNTSALADGLTEELINELTRESGLRVVARTSSFQYKNQARDVREIGRALSVDAVLEGSVRREQDKVRVTAQLIRASDGYHLWSASFDRKLTDALALQEEMARSIAGTLFAGRKPGANQSYTRLLPKDPQARESYLEGRYQWNFETGEQMSTALELFRKSAAIEPDYAPSHAFLADCYLMLSVYGQRKPADLLPLAKQEAERALALRPEHPLALSARGLAEVLSGGDRAKAERDFVAAIHAAPQSLRARFLYSYYLLGPAGRTSEADEHLAVAKDLDPFAATVAAGIIGTPFFARQYDKAARMSAVVMSKSSDDCFLCLVNSSWALGGVARFEEALETMRKAEKIVPDFPAAVRYEGYCMAKLGRKADAQATLNRLEEMSRKRYVGAENMAYVSAGLGERAATLGWLRKGLDERAFGMTFLDAFSGYDYLRGDPEYEHIRAQMGLPAR